MSLSVSLGVRWKIEVTAGGKRHNHCEQQALLPSTGFFDLLLPATAALVLLAAVPILYRASAVANPCEYLRHFGSAACGLFPAPSR